MTKRTRIAVTVGVLVGLQLAAIGIYRAVETSREPASARVSFKTQPMAAEQVPPLVGKRSDGSELRLAWPSQRMQIVHFWATWCEPCRDELPSLLAFARDMRERGLEVVAVAVDDDWKDIHAFFGGTVPQEVVIPTDATIHKRFGASSLPDSYLVDRSGKLVERYHGARDWRAGVARDHFLALVAKQ